MVQYAGWRRSRTRATERLSEFALLTGGRASTQGAPTNIHPRSQGYGDENHPTATKNAHRESPDTKRVYSETSWLAMRCSIEATDAAVPLVRAKIICSPDEPNSLAVVEMASY